MIAEAIEKIKDLAGRAARAQELEVYTVGKKVFVIDGKVVEVDADRDTRCHRVHTLESLTKIIEEVGDNTLVFVDTFSAKALLNDRVDSESLAFVDYAVDPFVKAILKGNFADLDHKWFVKNLRSKSADVAFGPESFVDAVRTVKFESQKSAESNQENLASSVGKNVASRASLASELPEDVKATVRPMPVDFPDFSLILDCRLSLDAEEETISLSATECEIDRVSRLIRSQVLGSLEDAIANLAVDAAVVEGTC